MVIIEVRIKIKRLCEEKSNWLYVKYLFLHMNSLVVYAINQTWILGKKFPDKRFVTAIASKDFYFIKRKSQRKT